MIVLSWNCWGLGNQSAVNILSQLVREKAPNILFLMETKQTVEEMRWVQGELHYDSMLAVSRLGRRGGLAMLWNNDVDLHIQTYTENHIDTFIFTDRNSPWRITRFYGKSEKQLCHETLDLLKHIKSRSLAPWSCIGDYNEIWHRRRRKVDTPNQLDWWIILEAHCYIPDWLIWDLQEICLLGIMEGGEMILFNWDLIGLVQ